MQNYKMKTCLAVAVTLAIFVVAFGVRQANAVVLFNFVATCDFCGPPLAVPGSQVTGELVLADSVLDMGVIPPGGQFGGADIVSLTLTFLTNEMPDMFTDVPFAGPFVPNIGGLLDPVGTFNNTGTGITMIDVRDALDQIFTVDLSAENPITFWALFDDTTFEGAGTPTSFQVSTAVPEPPVTLLWLLAATWLWRTERRRGRSLTRRA